MVCKGVVSKSRLQRVPIAKLYIGWTYDLKEERSSEECRLHPWRIRVHMEARVAVGVSGIFRIALSQGGAVEELMSLVARKLVTT